MKQLRLKTMCCPCWFPAAPCELEPLATNILEEFLPEIQPSMVDMCNAWLRQRTLRARQRHAIIMPRMKKLNADPADVKNYRSISNLTFVSKLIEGLIFWRLMTFLEQENLLPAHQSTYRKCHSTETAVLKIVSDPLLCSSSWRDHISRLSWSTHPQSNTNCCFQRAVDDSFGIGFRCSSR